jgi:hypothetical protein
LFILCHRRREEGDFRQPSSNNLREREGIMKRSETLYKEATKAQKLYGLYESQSHGSETFYRVPTLAQPRANLVITEGVKAFCEEYSAFWTVDLVASYIPKLVSEFKEDTFISIDIFRRDNSEACALFTDGDYGEMFHQDIGYTDLKTNVRFFLQPDRDPSESGVTYTLLCTSEY